MSRLIEILNVETSELDKNGRLVFTPPEPAREEEKRASSCTGGLSCSVGFRLTTLPHIDGKITQEFQEYSGDMMRTFTRWVMDSRDKGVHDALVQLGWTPPNVPPNASAALPSAEGGK